jgi:hypothetical protein
LTGHGAPFVGGAAATLAIGEIIRLLHGGPVHELIDLNLKSPEYRSAVPTRTDFSAFNPGYVLSRRPDGAPARPQPAPEGLVEILSRQVTKRGFSCGSVCRRIPVNSPSVLVSIRFFGMGKGMGGDISQIKRLYVAITCSNFERTLPPPVRLVSSPATWVTDYSGDMGNTFAPKRVLEGVQPAGLVAEISEIIVMKMTSQISSLARLIPTF